jgi:hypothetical protein
MHGKAKMKKKSESARVKERSNQHILEKAVESFPVLCVELDGNQI